MDVNLQALEAAINYWRARQPARGNEYALSPPVSRLATVYALMIFQHQAAIARASLDPAILALIDAAAESHPPD